MSRFVLWNRPDVGQNPTTLVYSPANSWPRRIVCLSAESADICARLGAWERVVGVTAYADQSGREARPVISGFSSADADRIAALQPEVVFTFSDVQAEISAALIRQGCTVIATNPRTLDEIGDAIRLIGRTIGAAVEAETLAAGFAGDLRGLRMNPPRRPRVYFEEWPDPLIAGIGWVREIVELCGGEDVFGTRRGAAASDRVVTSEDVIAACPEVILASWCGRPVDLEEIRRREGWGEIPAVKLGRIYEIPSDDILQPGPRLVSGARRIRSLLEGAVEVGEEG